MTLNGCSQQYKTIVNVIKFIESVINEFDGKRKSYRSYWFCQISVGFIVFCKKINEFKLKSPILDGGWFQNSHLTLINEKKSFSFIMQV